jgi:hypothetical protein
MDALTAKPVGYANVDRDSAVPAPAPAAAPMAPGDALSIANKRETAPVVVATAPSQLPRLENVTMEPGAGKLTVLDSPQPQPAARKAGMSLDVTSSEISAREAELALLAKALKQSNDEINRELSEMRRQENVSAPEGQARSSSADAAKLPESAAGAPSQSKQYVLKRTQTATAPKPATAVMSGAVTAFSSAPQSASTLSIRQEFSQAIGRQEFRRNFNSPPPVSVLQTFSVENTGSAVRIVDQDGSVYSGALEQEATQVSNLTRFPFSAIGLNRTLDQQVRFNGALEVTPEGQTQVRGRASVGIRTELEVNARPVPQR